LGKIASIGPDRRDIADGFSVSNSFTSYPALWGHEPNIMQTISLHTNQYLSPLTRPPAGRHLRKLEDLWPKASTLMISERLRLNTYRIVASLVDKPALSNVWWPVKMNNRKNASITEKFLVLWLNSTLGLILMLSYRGDTEGSWVQLKKPTLELLSVLDVEKLSSKARQVDKLFEKVNSESLLTILRSEADITRNSIDDGLCKMLNLPDISVVRVALAKEPIISLKAL
jgi:hypothetical protein